ncbi:hypothetical protein DAPPUDRAFT_320641 [Daphnia pulex]|uniref:Uncharacterized protein n=1 Tax=Daphnia pulex TaxID=6669 RepID=E9GQQ7_DAPPU|nr:hypothetical protein DAPPUDRAFT_320641 [Daphnia pulex]|eukprot:EFX78287.1 hypothetical protein DAPPUDRAFT_320641 [Daphnia pulex]
MDNFATPDVNKMAAKLNELESSVYQLLLKEKPTPPGLETFIGYADIKSALPSRVYVQRIAE